MGTLTFFLREKSNHQVLEKMGKKQKKAK